MRRFVPVWLFLLCLLLGSLFTVVFGWVVMSATQDTWRSARLGPLGEISVVIASFPNLVQRAFSSIGEDPEIALRVRRISYAAAEFHPVQMKSGIHVDGLVVRADEVALARERGWRILVGVFVIDGELNHAAIALSPELQIVNVWVLREEDVPGQEPRSKYLKFIHGFAVLKDGSTIFTMDEGVSIQRFDRCGKKMWSTGGNFDHTVVLDDSARFAWAVINDAMTVSEVAKVATATGEVVQRFSMADISAANPTIDILGIRQHIVIPDNDTSGNPQNTTNKWERDPIHLNDVEPLPAAIAGRFEGLRRGICC